ncbi:MAG: hypothetical protein PHY47_20595 [Lachnospiraceae bacterium]|nr:hypothetical protein [Lachnospiraceae bacterium]
MIKVKDGEVKLKGDFEELWVELCLCIASVRRAGEIYGKNIKEMEEEIRGAVAFSKKMKEDKIIAGNNVTEEILRKMEKSHEGVHIQKNRSR